MLMPTEQESGPSPARDRVCRGYRGHGEFVAHAQEFLAEGLHGHPRDGGIVALDGELDLPGVRGERAA